MNSNAHGRPEWRDDSVDELLHALGLLRTDEERAAFLRDLCTLAEIQAMAHRLAAARLVDRGMPYAEVAERVGGSTTTVTRVAHWLRHGEGGYRLVLDRLARRREVTPRGLLRLALPSKGRLAEPATRLLSDAGIQFETTGRTLHAHAHDLDLDLLLARSDDIPVWTAAGDVDLGIAGQNQIVETGADVEPLLELGFGRCRLALAVPAGRCRSRRSPTSAAAASRPRTRAPWRRGLRAPASTPAW